MKAVLIALMVRVQLLVAALFSLKYLILAERYPLGWPWLWPPPWALTVFRHTCCEEAFDLVTLSFVSYAIVTMFASGFVGFRWRMVRLRRRDEDRAALPVALPDAE